MAERILIVDDNAINLKLARVLLSGAGYDVRTAEDAGGMRSVLAEFHPDVILMDIQLPGEDGLTLARQLKADPATHDILIVALTAYAMKGDDERARAAGCDGYIAKPIETRNLVETIEGFLTARGSPPV